LPWNGPERPDWLARPRSDDALEQALQRAPAKIVGLCGPTFPWRFAPAATSKDKLILSAVQRLSAA
jgi:hypothetical protein